MTDVELALRRVLRRLRVFGPYRYGHLAQMPLRYAIGWRAPVWESVRPYVRERCGLEAGGPTWLFRSRGPLPLYPEVARLDQLNVHFEKGPYCEGLTARLAIRDPATVPPGRWLVGDVTEMESIPSEAYDFTLSSHTLEHLANPVQGLKGLVRATRKGGAVIVIVPHHEITFDHARRVTPLDHLLRDERERIREGDLGHLDLEEIFRRYDVLLDSGVATMADLRARTRENALNRMFHQHVFNTDLLLRLFDYVGLEIRVVGTEPFGIVLVGRKPDSAEDGAVPPSNEGWLSASAAWRRRSLFREDRIGAPREGTH